MRASDWIQEPVTSLLDVGCNVGAWLADCARQYPTSRLAGVEINEAALKIARQAVPTAELHHGSAEKLPFASESFDHVTCIEVLEHIPADLRPLAFREMWRVLKPGGRLILTVPHAGWFAWLDPNNVRFRLPRLYRRVLGRGRRDATYSAADRKIEWHHHFTRAELQAVVGASWRWVGVQRGGLFVSPLMDWLSWPFYRFEKPNHPVRRMFERFCRWDYRVDFGPASYRILIVLERAVLD